MVNYKGKDNRRTDDTSVRLALLEDHYGAIKESQISIHKRISEDSKLKAQNLLDIKKEMIEEMRSGTIAIFTKMDILSENQKKEKDAQQIKCEECGKEIVDMKSAIKSFTRILDTAWLAIVALGGWIFHHSSKGN